MPKWLAYSLIAILLWGVFGTVTTAAANRKASSDQIQLISTIGLLPASAIFLFSKNLKAGKNFGRGLAYAFLTGVSASTGNWSFYESLSLGGEGSTVYPLTGIYPIVTVVLAWMFLREQLNRVQLLGFALAIAAIVLVGILSADEPAPEASVKPWLERALSPWLLYALVTMVLFGVAAVLQKLATNNISNELSTVGFAVGFLPIGAVILLRKNPAWHLETTQWILCLSAGAIIGVGTLALFAAYRWGKATVVTAVTALNPLVTVVLAIPIFHEKFSLLKGTTIALALAAGMALTYEKKAESAV
jgi:transporter family protein